MSTKLFDQIVFGPIQSRRLGISLGVNLLPHDGKVCSFDCIYCECGFNSVGVGSGLPTYQQVIEAMNNRLKTMHETGEKLDVITFAGNGEPTLHPQFEEIIEETLKLRDRYFPETKVSVLSNATMLSRPGVFRALNRVDNNILKFDSALPQSVAHINAPNQPSFSVEKVVAELKAFKGNLTIQTLFLRGNYQGNRIDNTTEEEVTRWLEQLQEIAPKAVMLYSLDRETPAKGLEKVSREELLAIAARVEALGIATSVA